MTTVIGLDLSLTSTGICNTYGEVTTVAGKAGAGDQRLFALAHQIKNCLADRPVGLAVVEDLPRGAMGGTSTGMVQGVARYVLMSNNVPYVLVIPSVLKMYATGSGGANKSAMAVAAFKRAGIEFANDDECDSWWLRTMGLDACGEPLFDLPAGQRKALTKVHWPDGL